MSLTYNLNSQTLEKLLKKLQKCKSKEVSNICPYCTKIYQSPQQGCNDFVDLGVVLIGCS